MRETTGTPDFDPELLKGLEKNRWRVLYLLSGFLNSRSVDLERTLSGILSVVLAATRGDRALLLLKNEEGRLDVAGRRGLFPSGEGADRVSWTIVQKVFETERGLHVPSVAQAGELAGAQSVQEMKIRSALCVPLLSGVFAGGRVDEDRRRHPPHLGEWREVIGVIYVDGTQEREPYTEDDLSLLQALANIAATAITNARLHAEATRDASTGLFSRRYYEIVQGKIHALARERGFPYGILRLTLGDPGEAAVVAAGRSLLATVRDSDIAARHGPRSLAAILPYADGADTRRVAEKVAAALPAARIGASSFPDPGGEPGEAAAQADRALAAACEAGAERVVFWSPEIGMEGPRADPLAGLVTASEVQDQERLETIVEEHARAKARLAGPAVLLGESPALLASLDRARKVAPTGAAVLLGGESGTGKELFARLLHAQSPHQGGPFVVVDCGAIPENLLESELFGHEAGAFTGATSQHAGKFERATGGTLFLDEIGELPLALQAKILRAVQEREIERIGGKHPIAVDVRILAATNRNLEEEVRAGRFREDLYYRLNVVRIDLPPLRERGRDILLLAETFLARFARLYRKPVSGFDEGATGALFRHAWPGNVRELENRVQQAVILAEGLRLTAADLALPGAPGAVESYKTARNRAVAEFERNYLIPVLTRHAGDLAACAEVIGLSERRIREICQRVGLRPRDFLA
ncbi:MAG: sigma 54-interacting transcriptional regulator [Planctomycetes bacterium]|nr:sigma 54-interacting transcriptional regulator [Planctomycetota bacterium]